MRQTSLFGLAALCVVLLFGGCTMQEPDGIVYSCTPPEIVNVDPGPGETDVPLDEDITITFSVPMDSASFDSSSLILIHGTDTVPGDLSYDPSDTTLTFTPEDSLLPDEPYTVILVPEFLDTLGFPLDTVYTWTFTTEDSLPPPPDDIGEIFPKDGQEDVPLDTVITITFDTSFIPSDFDTNSIILKLGDDTIPGTITFDPIDSTLVFDPEDSLIPETTYTVIVTIPDGPGGALGPPPDTTIITTFTTVDSIPKAPILEAIKDGSTYVLSAQSDAFLRLYWFPAPGPVATTYRFQLSTSPTFATTVLDAPGIPNNSFIVTKKIPHGVLVPGIHYWRVSASNSGGTSPWSTVWTFTVAP